VLERFATRADHDAALLARLRECKFEPGDVAVLSVTSWGAKDALRLFADAGIPAIDLADYAGLPVAAVKVGTVKRAKGLEFKLVLMPRVLPAWLEPPASEDEAHAIHRRELYVGMTRARDELWVGACS
jgi:superfamily I DNA/RNA helicase